MIRLPFPNSGLAFGSKVNRLIEHTAGRHRMVKQSWNQRRHGTVLTPCRVSKGGPWPEANLNKEANRVYFSLLQLSKLVVRISLRGATHPREHEIAFSHTCAGGGACAQAPT